MLVAKVCHCFYSCKQNDNIFHTFCEKSNQNDKNNNKMSIKIPI